MSSYLGKALVHIRERVKGADDRWLFTKRVISLLEGEWKDLTRAAAPITASLKRSGGEELFFLGSRGRRATLKTYKGVRYLDIRNYWDITNRV